MAALRSGLIKMSRSRKAKERLSTIPHERTPRRPVGLMRDLRLDPGLGKFIAIKDSWAHVKTELENPDQRTMSMLHLLNVPVMPWVGLIVTRALELHPEPEFWKMSIRGEQRQLPHQQRRGRLGNGTYLLQFVLL
ncbi:hypothetical protein H1C71_006098 [Ictidomys tridecemlineatus]|nr:hypothetical protein H1C71_006098 [Ictidomys tridecemlineatus]